MWLGDLGRRAGGRPACGAITTRHAIAHSVAAPIDA
jgi:hypothetical protein